MYLCMLQSSKSKSVQNSLKCEKHHSEKFKQCHRYKEKDPPSNLFIRFEREHFLSENSKNNWRKTKQSQKLSSLILNWIVSNILQIHTLFYKHETDQVRTISFITVKYTFLFVVVPFLSHIIHHIRLNIIWMAPRKRQI